MILPEIVAAGIYDSRIAVRNTAVSKNRKTTMFELELPLENGGISYIDTNSFPIKPNMIICAKPNQKRHTKFPFKCYYVHMIIHSGPLYNTLINMPDFFETDKYNFYFEIFKKIVKHYDSLSTEEELILHSVVLELLYTLSKDATKQYLNPKQINNRLIIDNTVKYIKEHLTEELNLEIVAKQMSLSPIYFHNMFKASVGKTLRDYIEEQRIKKAINLLQTTDFSLTKISFECGFSSQSYFSFVFKRKMKKTPRQYVREIYYKYEI